MTGLGYYVIAGIFTLATTLIFFVKDKGGKDRGYALLFAIYPGALVGIVTVVVSLIIGTRSATKTFPERPRIVEQHSLKSVVDRNSLFGSFVLASGSISDNTVTYSVYILMDDGGAVHRSISELQDVRIYEFLQDTEIPRIEYYVLEYDCTIPLNPLRRLFVICPSGSIFALEHWIEIHVPVGTIQQQFEINK